MDIVSALAVLSPVSGEIRDPNLYFPGAWHPVTIPALALSPEQRRQLLTHGSSTDKEAALSLALKIGDEELCWDLYNGLSLDHLLSAPVDLQFKAWTAAQLKKIGLAEDGPHIRIKATRAQVLKFDRRLYHIENSVRSMLSSMPWPLWSGPLLIQADDKTSIVNRPVLPVIRLSDDDWNDAALSRQLCRLALLRYQQTTAALPAWLMEGLTAVAEEKCAGTGPSPRKMLRIRSQAGADAIRALWENPEPDRALSAAVCAPLVHTRSKHQLASFIGLINHRVPAERALIIAYQRDLESLLSEP